MHAVLQASTTAPVVVTETDSSGTADRQAVPKQLNSHNILFSAASPAGPDTLPSSVPLNLTFSNSSNSTNCCIPSVSPQAALSYDIKASAHITEQLPSSNSLFPNVTAAPQHQQPAYANSQSQGLPLSAANATRLHQFMASVFDDVDSGRLEHSGMASNHFPRSASPHNGQSIFHASSFSPEVRNFFPASIQPSQQQLQTQFLAQQLLEQQQQRDSEQQHQQPPVEKQHPSSPQAAWYQAATQRRGPATAHWQHPLANSVAESEQSHKAAKQSRSRVAAQHQLDELDLSGPKRDFSSFSSPSSQGKPNRQAATRRANSFTHGSAASVSTASPPSTARKPRGVASSSQAAASGGLATPLTSMANLPDSDVSVSDADGQSGAEESEGGIKRQRIVKGRRGGFHSQRTLHLLRPHGPAHPSFVEC